MTTKRTPFTDAVDAELAVAWYRAYVWWPKMPADSNFEVPRANEAGVITESMLRRASGLFDNEQD